MTRQLSSTTTDEFSTSALGLATWLVYRGHEPRIEATDDDRCVFRFATGPELMGDVNGYENGDAREMRRYESVKLEVRRRMDAAKGVTRR